MFTALWGLRLARTLLSLSNEIERLARVRLSVCAASSGRHRVWKLASGSQRLKELHAATKAINVCEQRVAVGKRHQGKSKYSKSIRSRRNWILCKCLNQTKTASKRFSFLSTNSIKFVYFANFLTPQKKKKPNQNMEMFSLQRFMSSEIQMCCHHRKRRFKESLESTCGRVDCFHS